MKKKDLELYTFKIDYIFLILPIFTFGYYLNNHLNSFFLADFDYLALNEVILNTLKGNFFETTHYTKFIKANYLSHHLAFILVLFVPFQYLTEIRLGYAYGMYFLFIINLILPYFILFKYDKNDSERFLVFILIITNSFFYKLSFSYHFEVIFFTLVLLSYLFKKLNYTKLELISLIFCLLIKEDIFIYVIIYSIYFYIYDKEKRYLTLILISILYFLVFYFYLQPNLPKEAKVDWLSNWSFYTDINPFKSFLEKVLSKTNIFVKIFFIFILCFILRGSTILILSPIFILHFSSDRIWYNTFENYYIYTILPLLSIFTIDTFIKSTFKYKKYILLFSLSFLCYNYSLDKTIPYKLKIENPVEVQNLKKIIQLIPLGKEVSISYDLGAFIPKDIKLYPIRPEHLNREYILYNSKSFSPFVELNEIESKLVYEKKYIMINEIGNYKLWKKINNDLKHQ